MLFKILSKEGFKDLIQRFMELNEVIAPKVIGRDRHGQPLHQFLPVESFAEIDLGYRMTQYSAKTYFLPFCENLATYTFTDTDWKQEINYRLHPRILLGLRNYDINALLKLDKVLARDRFPSPYYISRRKNTFIIGIDHEPQADEFSHAVGTDNVTHGFDLFLTDLGDRYFIAVNSDRAFTIMEEIGARDVAEKDTHAYLEARKAVGNRPRMDLHTHNLPNLLDLEFESPVWKKWGKKCFSCGSCSMVCPTCYCYGIKEPIAMNFRRSAQVKQLYSCNIKDFAEVAGGHNFRNSPEVRLKYRYYHQFRGFAESYDEPKCVGCNRCGKTCLAGINPPDIIRDLQLEEHA